MEYVSLNKTPMDTVIFVIDTTSNVVTFEDKSVYPFYYNREFKELGFKVIIQGKYLDKYKNEISIDRNFQKIFIYHLLSDAYWFKVEHPVIYLQKMKIKNYKIYDEKYLASLEDIYVLRDELGPIPWLRDACCFFVFKEDWNKENCLPIKLYRIGFSYNYKQW